MDFLRLLEGMRTDWLDAIMSAVTYMGDEIFFMVAALTVYWCVSKRQGYYVFAVGLLGTISNQFLKLWYRLPRPWVIDPDFTIVEAARGAATGYSFPSGHTQSVVGTLGSIAVSSKQKWLRIICAVFIIVVPFSRMYLGVHTPLDVGVGFGSAALLVILMYPVFKDDTRSKKYAPVVLCVLLLSGIAYLLFVTLYQFPAEVYTDPDENLIHGTHNAYLLLGCSCGIIVAYIFDNKYLHFDTKASFMAQVLKVILGLGLIVAIKGVLKAPLSNLFNGSEVATAVRYFIMVVFGGCIWPMTFPFFAKLGKKKNVERN